MARVESFAAVLNDYLAETGMGEREFILRAGLHPTTITELRCGADPGNTRVLGKLVTNLGLSRDWTARLYLALLAERDGPELLRAAGLAE